ncbi:hypothetical protein [Cyanobium sp. Morenito 9A2]|uniref:hypothetical protein n=1 Tax=Cyanobium sp. Morenito 9A2 TaxID=2823718 RepID=UPI0020CEFFD0|nr:hypothetical protein [Cyanobium sp. Morenito 9A2]MCP9848995.1 hypothetical protein [Cyanobium sp. Morenito 9A2]
MSSEASTHPMAPLIRFTLLALYGALVLPLPLLAPDELRALMLVAVPLGCLAVVAITSERVRLESTGISVGHPPWCAWLLRRGWQLEWDQIVALVPVATSQGGRVFYLRSRDGSAYLLPQRLARFEDFLARLQAETGLDLSTVGRLTPPWTYQLLGVLSGLVLLGEWVALMVVGQGGWPARLLPLG